VIVFLGPSPERPELRVRRGIDLPHAGADGGKDFVKSTAGAGSEGHRLLHRHEALQFFVEMLPHHQFASAPDDMQERVVAARGAYTQALQGAWVSARKPLIP